MISRIITTRMGAAKAIGRFITMLTSLPQKPCSTSARVLVFCVRSPSQVSQAFIGFQLRKNGTRSSVRTPSASTLGPRMASAAASTVIERMAANMTEAMIAYVIDLRNPCGNSRSGIEDATRITAENMTVRPEVIIVRRTAASVS